MPNTARMLSSGDEAVELELPPDSDVIAILLDNGQRIDVKIDTYREYVPLDAGGLPCGPPIYILRPVENIDTLMVGFVRNIIATYYHSPWTPE